MGKLAKAVLSLLRKEGHRQARDGDDAQLYLFVESRFLFNNEILAYICAIKGLLGVFML